MKAKTILSAVMITFVAASAFSGCGAPAKNTAETTVLETSVPETTAAPPVTNLPKTDMYQCT